jgi:hypothetical protein
MTDGRTPAPPDRPSGRVAPAALASDPAAKAAAAELAAARDALTGELATLRASARAAVDVKAKVRRNVGKTAAAVGGAAFLAVGGPRRAFRAVRRRVAGEPEPLPASLLPEEVEKAVQALGDDGAKVRGALERGFAGWLGATAKDRKAEDRQRSVVNLAMKIGVPAASRAAREVVSRALREPGAGDRPGSGDNRPGGRKPTR